MANIKSKKNDHGFGRFDFMKLAPLMGGISALAVVLSLVVIGLKGFEYGIDFAGGTELQVQFSQPVESSKVRAFAETVGLKNAEIQSFPKTNEYVLRFESDVKGATVKETTDALNALVEKTSSSLKATFQTEGPEIRRVDTVGPQVGQELKRSGLLAAFYSMLVILIYVGLRFDYQMATSSVLCLFHDVIVTLGIFALFDRQVNVQTMASVMTIIGYSINDTIINFDRIRENIPLFREKPMSWIVNRSVNDMLSRSILTSFATFLSVSALYLMAGGVIEDLAFTFGIGIIVGSYSSIYVASPLVLVMDKLSPTKTATA